MALPPDLVAELTVLSHYSLGSQHEGIKIHKDADPAIVAASKRLYEKGLLSQADGGYLTNLGLEAAEHIQHTLHILR